ncbi:hypothetical protein XcyCFBP4188_11920 [Xanthomonas hortorum pv. cynarae]|nr:hypothetical protein XcyCFBP4188_11920 [Xanthomonas hortorum pv. cynarae]
MQFLAAGGSVMDIERYLRRVESSLAPKLGTQMTAAAKLRDFATMLRIEITDADLHILQKRVHQAALDRRRAEARFRRIDASFQRDISKALNAIREAAGLLQDTEITSWPECFSRRHGFERVHLNERRKLVNETTVFVASLMAVEAVSDPGERHFAFVELHAAQSSRVHRCLEALELSRWRLPSTIQRTDLPGKYGVVKCGRFADFDGLLRTAQTAWLRCDPTKIQKALKIELEASDIANRRSQDMAGMPANLMNWLAMNSEVHSDPIRPKAGERGAAEAGYTAKPSQCGLAR